VSSRIRGDTWWAAVSGAIPGEQPCPGCCRRAAVPLGAALTAASRSGPGSGSHWAWNLMASLARAGL